MHLHKAMYVKVNVYKCNDIMFVIIMIRFQKNGQSKPHATLKTERYGIYHNIIFLYTF